MALELECKLVRKLAVQNGSSARGTWSKQDFIVEYQDGRFPVQLCMNVWGDEKVKDFENFQVGDLLKIGFALSSREFNGRWYTDIRAYRIEKAGAAQAAAPEQGLYSTTRAMATGYGTAPAPQQGYAPAPQAPAPTINDMPAEPSDDDLPF